jgi:transcriptional regulator with XRE-family HTH domain
MDTDAATGLDVERRRVRLGLSISALANEAKVDRSRISAIEAGDPSVRESTIGAVRSALARLEHEMGMDELARPIGNQADGLVEFVIEGNFGVRAVVKGPVSNLDALSAAAGKLVRDLREAAPGDDDSSD